MGKGYQGRIDTVQGEGYDEKNPFFPTETEFDGPGKSIHSTHGSLYDAGGVHNTNEMDSRLDRARHGGIKGGK